MGTSSLESSGDRFLSLCIQYAVENDWLAPQDLIEEFPAEKLMTALEGAPALRAKLLVEAAGVHEKIAPKKSTSAAAEDLQIALDEGICTADTVLGIVSVDDQVRYLDKNTLWALLTRDQFWFQDGERPQARMLTMIKTAIDQDLIDFPRLVRAVTPEQLTADLPRELIESALCTAIHAGLDGVAFEPETLLESISLETWIEHLPLSHFWETVIKAEIASSAGLGGDSPITATDASDDSPTDDGGKKKKKKRDGKDTAAASPAPPAPSSNDAELQARTQAVQNLEKIERLPKDADKLSSPVLLGLDAMYEELLETETDEDRADLIRDAFPNNQMLHEALFALAETLDPRLTRKSLEDRGADTNAIIQLVLFEERKRAARSSRAPSPSSPPPAVKPPTVPPPPSSSVGTTASPAVSQIPPLPPQARRASTPPPPLPAQARKAR